MFLNAPQQYSAHIEALRAICAASLEFSWISPVTACEWQLELKYGKQAEAMCKSAYEVVQSVPIACYALHSGASTVDVAVGDWAKTWHFVRSGDYLHITNATALADGLRAKVEYCPHEGGYRVAANINGTGGEDVRRMVRACDPRALELDWGACSDCITVLTTDKIFDVLQFKELYRVSAFDPELGAWTRRCAYGLDYAYMERHGRRVFDYKGKVYAVFALSEPGDIFLRREPRYIEASVKEAGSGKYYYQWADGGVVYAFMGSGARHDVARLAAVKIDGLRAYAVKLNSGYALVTPHSYTVYTRCDDYVDCFDVALPAELYTLFSNAAEEYWREHYGGKEEWAIIDGCLIYDSGEWGFCNRGDGVEVIDYKEGFKIRMFPHP